MINSFSSIFEILVVFNLAYAGSITFRNALDENIFKLTSVFPSELKYNISQITNELLVIFNSEFEKKIKEKFEDLERVYNIKTFKIKKKADNSANFPNGIKAIFLLTTIFCFSILIVGSFEQYYEKDKVNCLIAFINLTFIINFIFFIRNLNPKFYQKNPKTIYVILFFLLPILLHHLYVVSSDYNVVTKIFIPSSQFNTVLAVIFAFSAFMFHFIRVFMHKYIFRVQLKWINVFTKRKIKLYGKSISRINKISY